MKTYVAKKFLSLLVTMVLISLVTFFVFQILPGNPAQLILGVDADPFQIEALERQMNLDKPMTERYQIWVMGLIRGDLGQSLRFHAPVGEIILGRLEVTILLSLFSLLLSVALSIPLSIVLAKYHEHPISQFFSGITQIGLSIPSFWLALLLIGIFSVSLSLLPSGGYVSITTSVGDCIRSLILPTISLSVGMIAMLSRYLKSNIVTELNKDYVRTARSKGLSEQKIMYRHVLRNALLPMLTVLGMLSASVLGGSIVIESVFRLPGIGSLVASAIGSRDFPLIQSLVVYLAFIVVTLNFVIDILYSVIDPRIRLR